MTETENDVEVVHKCILSRKPRHLGIFSLLSLESQQLPPVHLQSWSFLFGTPQLPASVSTLKLWRSIRSLSYPLGK